MYLEQFALLLFVIIITFTFLRKMFIAYHPSVCQYVAETHDYCWLSAHLVESVDSAIKGYALFLYSVQKLRVFTPEAFVWNC